MKRTELLAFAKVEKHKLEEAIIDAEINLPRAYHLMKESAFAELKRNVEQAKKQHELYSFAIERLHDEIGAGE